MSKHYPQGATGQDEWDYWMYSFKLMDWIETLPEATRPSAVRAAMMGWDLALELYKQDHERTITEEA